MRYPESVLTVNSKGEKEVRRLVRRGEFVEYDYIDPETGETKEKGKRSIVLKTEKGQEHYFLIPIKGNRFLAIAEKGWKKRELWDGEKAVDV